MGFVLSLLFGYQEFRMRGLQDQIFEVSLTAERNYADIRQLSKNDEALLEYAAQNSQQLDLTKEEMLRMYEIVSVYEDHGTTREKVILDAMIEGFEIMILDAEALKRRVNQIEFVLESK